MNTGTSSTAGEAFVPIAQCGDFKYPAAPRTGPTVLEFLNSIDADELNAAALAVGSGLGGPTVAEAFLIALTAMAQRLDDA